MHSHAFYELQQEIRRLMRKVEVLGETVEELKTSVTPEMKLELIARVNKAGIAISDAVVYANIIHSKLNRF